jgi:hypothetical protein
VDKQHRATRVTLYYVKCGMPLEREGETGGSAALYIGGCK